jgi:hypothetical protein
MKKMVQNNLEYEVNGITSFPTLVCTTPMVEET